MEEVNKVESSPVLHRIRTKIQVCGPSFFPLVFFLQHASLKSGSTLEWFESLEQPLMSLLLMERDWPGVSYSASWLKGHQNAAILFSGRK